MKLSALLVALGLLVSATIVPAPVAAQVTVKAFLPLCTSKDRSQNILCAMYLAGLNDEHALLAYAVPRMAPVWCPLGAVAVDDMLGWFVTYLNDLNTKAIETKQDLAEIQLRVAFEQMMVARYPCSLPSR